VKPPQVVTLSKRIALAREKGAMAARFVRKSPTMSVRLATGAYGANYVRSAVMGAPPLRRWYERAAGGSRAKPSAFAAFAAEALVDAAYVDALRAALRRGDG
jgi:hypothetical protein